MKRVLKFLARLYPSDWRKRYGVEYEALLEQTRPRARDAFDVLCSAVNMHLTGWDLRRIVLPCAIAGALIAAAISFAVPPRYVSQTVISVTTRTADPKGDTNTQDSADAALRELKDSLLSDTSLAPILQKLDLYPRERTRMSPEDLIHRMRKDINFRQVMSEPGQSAVALQFSYPDPRVAQRVGTELVSVTMASVLRSRINHSSRSPNTQEIFRVEHAPNLPLAPSFPRRGVFGAGGLFAGIAAGLMLTAITRRHRENAGSIQPNPSL